MAEEAWQPTWRCQDDGWSGGWGGGWHGGAWASRCGGWSWGGGGWSGSSSGSAGRAWADGQDHGQQPGRWMPSELEAGLHALARSIDPCLVDVLQSLGVRVAADLKSITDADVRIRGAPLVAWRKLQEACERLPAGDAGSASEDGSDWEQPGSDLSEEEE
ncbi:unnamed protein product, partial [Prorocentrum cordatum]